MSEEQFDPKQPENPTPPPFNPNPFPPQNGGYQGLQQSLPNATIVLVLGILSIVTCCCWGVIGLVLSVVALILSKKDRALYEANATYYTEGSFKNLNAGRVCAIIGLILNIIYLLITIVCIAFFGWESLSDPNAMKEAIEGLQ